MSAYHLSIHDLTRRSTLTSSVVNTLIGSFNSRPHKEVDHARVVAPPGYLHLSIHDLTRRSTNYSYQAVALLIFQFTTSQGGRRLFRNSFASSLIFQFTTSQGGRLACSEFPPVPQYLSIHDLTRRSTP